MLALRVSVYVAFALAVRSASRAAPVSMICLLYLVVRSDLVRTQHIDCFAVCVFLQFVAVSPVGVSG